MPALRADLFRFDQDRGNWWAPCADRDSDILVPGTPESPDLAALELASVALEQLDKLLHVAEQYYGHFIDLGKSSLQGQPGLVSISSGFSPGVVRISMNYESDPYGLWWVDFKLEPVLGLTPFSFGRTAW